MDYGSVLQLYSDGFMAEFHQKPDANQTTIFIEKKEKTKKSFETTHTERASSWPTNDPSNPHRIQKITRPKYWGRIATSWRRPQKLQWSRVHAQKVRLSLVSWQHKMATECMSWVFAFGAFKQRWRLIAIASWAISRVKVSGANDAAWHEKHSPSPHVARVQEAVPGWLDKYPLNMALLSR